VKNLTPSEFLIDRDIDTTKTVEEFSLVQLLQDFLDEKLEEIYSQQKEQP
jgi:hypothetical protein